ncbi:MAG: hypothetical protein HQ461_03460 [Deltaproteobacteria bacterium]|nr:hypothetical protein [Deltaproteobacteria bacterium]
MRPHLLIALLPLLCACASAAPLVKRAEPLVAPGCIPAGWEKPPEKVGQTPGPSRQAPASALLPFEGSGSEGSGLRSELAPKLGCR